MRGRTHLLVRTSRPDGMPETHLRSTPLALVRTPPRETDRRDQAFPRTPGLSLRQSPRRARACAVYAHRVWIPGEPMRFVVELNYTADGVCGEITREGFDLSERFCGWLELLRLLEPPQLDDPRSRDTESGAGA